MGKLKIWAPEEDTILIKVSHTIKSKKWKKASQQLKKHGFERTDVECRQRFINHLDPTVNKELWTEQELQILYTKYDEYGHKWFLLQKHLPGRTQTKIKNYFYGNIRYLLKIIVKFFYQKSTGFINDIKTQTLLEIYEGKGEFQDDNLIHRTIKQLRYKVQKKECQKLIKQNISLYENFIEHFLAVEQDKSQEQESDNYSPKDVHSPKQVQVIRIECLPMPATKVEVVASTSGDIIDKTSQLEYLRAMVTNHLKWLEFYENKIRVLQEREEKSTD